MDTQTRLQLARNDPIIARRFGGVFARDLLPNSRDRILDADDFIPKKKAKKFDLNLSEELENKNVQIPNYSVYLGKNTAIELFGNINVYIWLESQMRLGLVSKRYAKANNPSLSSIYDPSKPHSYILALDIVNPYGYAMSQFLPNVCVCGDFYWLSLEEINNSE
ncbi:uncharacterized protein TNCV_3986181 [Trichonephila clavipes]|nr:uncharacterized protein TNCV_3986181 [Trichonephila clavipes]